MPVMVMRNEWHVKKRISISHTFSCPMGMCELAKSPSPNSPTCSGTVDTLTLWIEYRRCNLAFSSQ